MKISVLNSGLTITDLGVIVDSILSEQADGVFYFAGVADGTPVVNSMDSVGELTAAESLGDATELHVYKADYDDKALFDGELANNIISGTAETVSMTRENGRYLTTTAEGNVAEIVSGNANFKRLGTFGELLDAVSKGKVLSGFRGLILDQPNSEVNATGVDPSCLENVFVVTHLATITEISKLSRGFGE